jgi:3-dehydroquinate synthase
MVQRAGTDRPKNIAVFVDDGLLAGRPGLLTEIREFCRPHSDLFRLAADPVVFPGGETVKNTWKHVQRTTDILNAAGIDRHGLVIALGGGALLDMAGFAAAIFHRGVEIIRLPTTTLAQNDAGIGVKNGINQYGQKNCIGTFSIPSAVVCDFDFTQTLSFDHFIAGAAEAFKIALIRDASFFSFLELNASLLKHRHAGTTQEMIQRCARLHLDHIAGRGDPFESGSARPLDYGHWSAHKMEILSGHKLPHGLAVAVGTALDSFYAWQKSLISEADFHRIVTALCKCGLPVYSPYLACTDGQGRLEMENGLEEFRLHLGGTLTFTMPDGIGSSCELHEMDFDIVREGISFLKRYSEKAEPGRLIHG